MPHRFLIPKYVLHTIKLKWKQLAYSYQRDSYPFNSRIKIVLPIQNVEWTSTESPYVSFDYFSCPSDAEEYYVDNNTPAKFLILGLIHAKYGHYEKAKYYYRHIIQKCSIKEGKMIIPNQAYKRFNTKNNYPSALTQGKAISLAIQLYSTFEEKAYLQDAQLLAQTMLLNVEDGGTMIFINNDTKWLEEYPSEKPTMVLNGFIFGVIGLIDLYLVTRDSELKTSIDELLSSLLSWLPAFRIKDEVLYSMYFWNLSNWHYRAVYYYQFKHLYELTGIDEFQQFAQENYTAVDWSSFNKMIKK